MKLSEAISVELSDKSVTGFFSECMSKKILFCGWEVFTDTNPHEDLSGNW